MTHAVAKPQPDRFKQLEESIAEMERDFTDALEAMASQINDLRERLQVDEIRAGIVT